MNFWDIFASSAETTLNDPQTSSCRNTKRDIDEPGLLHLNSEVTRTKARGQAEPPPPPPPPPPQLTTQPTSYFRLWLATNNYDEPCKECRSIGRTECDIDYPYIKCERYPVCATCRRHGLSMCNKARLDCERYEGPSISSPGYPSSDNTTPIHPRSSYITPTYSSSSYTPRNQSTSSYATPVHYDSMIAYRSSPHMQSTYEAPCYATQPIMPEYMPHPHQPPPYATQPTMPQYMPQPYDSRYNPPGRY